MARFKPHTPYNVPMILLAPQYTMVKGQQKKNYPAPDVDNPGNSLFYGSFRTFGGTETTENDLYSVIDTAKVETWFRPDIKSDCAVYLPETGETYQVKGTPENIERRNQFLQFKVQRLGGGA